MEKKALKKKKVQDRQLQISHLLGINETFSHRWQKKQEIYKTTN